MTTTAERKKLIAAFSTALEGVPYPHILRKAIECLDTDRRFLAGLTAVDAAMIMALYVRDHLLADVGMVGKDGTVERSKESLSRIASMVLLTGSMPPMQDRLHVAVGWIEQGNLVDAEAMLSSIIEDCVADTMVPS